MKLSTVLSATALSFALALPAAAASVFATDVLATTGGGVAGRDVATDTLGGPDGSFYSLGGGGSIDLGFGTNITGEITIYETTFGSRQNWFESAEVYGLNMGVATLIGTISNVTEPNVLMTAMIFDSLRIVDTTPGGTFQFTDGGFDIDAVSAAAVPLPAGLVLLGAGLGALGVARARKAA